MTRGQGNKQCPTLSLLVFINSASENRQEVKEERTEGCVLLIRNVQNLCQPLQPWRKIEPEYKVE